MHRPWPFIFSQISTNQRKKNLDKENFNRHQKSSRIWQNYRKNNAKNIKTTIFWRNFHWDCGHNDVAILSLRFTGPNWEYSRGGRVYIYIYIYGHPPVFPILATATATFSKNRSVAAATACTFGFCNTSRVKTRLLIPNLVFQKKRNERPKVASHPGLVHRPWPLHTMPIKSSLPITHTGSFCRIKHGQCLL